MRQDPQSASPMLDLSAKFLGEDDFALDLLLWSGEPGDGTPKRHKLPKLEEHFGQWKTLPEPRIGQFFRVRVKQQYAATHNLMSDITFGGVTGSRGPQTGGGSIYG